MNILHTGCLILLCVYIFFTASDYFSLFLKMTLKMGKNTQKEIAELISMVITSAMVSPPPPRFKPFMNR